MQEKSKIRWHWVFMIGFGSTVLFVLCHVLFVAYYSYLMNPGQEVAHYGEFAQFTGPPFVAFFGPLPLFLALRWIGRKAPDRAYLHAVLYIAVSFMIEIVVTYLAGQPEALFTWAGFVAEFATDAGALAGAWTARKEVSSSL